MMVEAATGSPCRLELCEDQHHGAWLHHANDLRHADSFSFLNWKEGVAERARPKREELHVNVN